MAITVSISPTGLILESEARKNPNFVWDNYLEVTPVTLPNGDQYLTHNELDRAWTSWLYANFVDIALISNIDQALDPILLNNSWSPEHGITGVLELTDEDYAMMIEKINVPIETDMVTFTITA
jgi:hypothetical protein